MPLTRNNLHLNRIFDGLDQLSLVQDLERQDLPRGFREDLQALREYITATMQLDRIRFIDSRSQPLAPA